MKYTEACDLKGLDEIHQLFYNAAKSVLAYPALLAGYRTTADAMTDRNISRYVREYMDSDATPFVKYHEGFDLEDFKHLIVKYLSDKDDAEQLSRIAEDGLTKIMARITPTLLGLVDQGHEMSRAAFFVAAYRHYLKYHRDDMGNELVINEPTLTEDEREKVMSDDPIAFLSLKPFATANLASSREFVARYLEMADTMAEQGVPVTLAAILEH